MLVGLGIYALQNFSCKLQKYVKINTRLQLTFTTLCYYNKPRNVMLVLTNSQDFPKCLNINRY